MNTFEGSYGSKDSGVLMPFRALPGDHDHQGTLGSEAVEFLDTVSDAGFKIVHDLPSSPPDLYNSPYSSVSAFALDAQRIDLYQLAEAGYIDRFDLDRYQKLTQVGDAGPEIRNEKEALLRRAFVGFSSFGSSEQQQAFSQWIQEEADWLDSYAAYEILKDLPVNRGKRWQEWQIGKDRGARLIYEIKDKCSEEFSSICFEQWVAHEQTMLYLQEAERRGIEIWGDVPFYVGDGEVWANRGIFNLNDEGYQINQGGAAPSMTSETGQLWGFPTYKIDGHRNPEQTAKVVDWWDKRLQRVHTLNNGKVRLDHFIGFAEPYIIAADAKDGMGGKSEVGIGSHLLNTLVEKYGADLPFYPEDLGTQTEKTGELRDLYGLPCNTVAVRGLTKCLGNNTYYDSIHNPDRYRQNSVNMSSNHDMLPLLGTINTIRDGDPQAFEHYVKYINTNHPHEDIGVETTSMDIARLEMKRIMRSVGTHAIMGIWDVLGLDKNGRYNIPGKVLPSNWAWRMDSTLMSKFKDEAPYWSELNATTGRSSQELLAAAAD